jgi:hypothetical protein
MDTNSLNPFGYENVSHIKASFFNQKFSNNEERLTSLIYKIYFNPACPQNKNIMIDGEDWFVWNGNSWENRDSQYVLDGMTQSAKRVIRMYLLCASISRNAKDA